MSEGEDISMIIEVILNNWFHDGTITIPTPEGPQDIYLFRRQGASHGVMYKQLYKQLPDRTISLRIYEYKGDATNALERTTPLNMILPTGEWLTVKPPRNVSLTLILEKYYLFHSPSQRSSTHNDKTI